MKEGRKREGRREKKEGRRSKIERGVKGIGKCKGRSDRRKEGGRGYQSKRYKCSPIYIRCTLVNACILYENLSIIPEYLRAIFRTYH